MLDYSDFLELANHILRGDQVVVRGNDVTTVTSIIHVLKVRNRCASLILGYTLHDERPVCGYEEDERQSLRI